MSFDLNKTLVIQVRDFDVKSVSKIDNYISRPLEHRSKSLEVTRKPRPLVNRMNTLSLPYQAQSRLCCYTTPHLFHEEYM